MGGPPHMGGGYHAPPQAHYSRPPKRDIPTGPPVTVFVGNITERAPDAMIRHLLTTCGPVVSWKRVQGATGKLQAFGFCEYSNPDAGMRSIRLLNSYQIADKSLVVKVDAKTKKILDEYLTDRVKKNGEDIPGEGELDKYMDEDMKYEDSLAEERIGQILKDHSQEIESYVPKEPAGLPVAREAPPASTLLQRMGTRDEGLDDIEEEKKGVIHREIDKFRETMKIREAEKEEQEKKRGEKESSTSSRRKSRSKSREKSRDRGDREGRSSSTRERPSRRSRSRDRGRERETERQRDREREREREREQERERESQRRSVVSRSRSRSPPRFERERGSRETRSQKEIFKEREMEEEEKERKRAERKGREKEANYQERLRIWETREGKKSKDYEKEQVKDKKKTDEIEREGRKLKEFLEDYDDERDDPKFYKGRELARRLQDREREATKDSEDRRKELDEISQLKSQIFNDPKLADPATEFQRRLQEREQQFLPDSLKSTPPPAAPTPPTKAVVSQGNSRQSPIELDISPSPDNSPGDDRGPSPMDAMDDYDPGDIALPDMDEPEDSPTPEAPEPVKPVTIPTVTKTKVEAPKRKKLPVADIFNQEEEEESDKPRMKKLKPLPPAAAKEEKKEVTKSADDKRKHIKSLIEKIPTDKGALFAYSVDWDLVDNQLMEKRIRPWVHKKIAEYIGEPEPTLTDFICSKVLAGSEPKAILEDVQMVLDEEAEVFVVKMWRLLIYEIENKKQKSSGVAK